MMSLQPVVVTKMDAPAATASSIVVTWRGGGRGEGEGSLPLERLLWGDDGRGEVSFTLESWHRVQIGHNSVHAFTSLLSPDCGFCSYTERALIGRDM